MNTKTLGIGLIVVGILIVVAVFLAGPLGLASTSFGTKHIIGLVVGIIVFIVGLVMSVMKRPSMK